MSQARAARPTSALPPDHAPLTCLTMSPVVAGSAVSVAVVVASLSGISAVTTLVDPDQQAGTSLPMVLLFLTAVGVCVVAGLNVRWLVDNPGAVADARAGNESPLVRTGGARATQARPPATPAGPTGPRRATAEAPTGPIAVGAFATPPPVASPPVVLAPRPATLVPAHRASVPDDAVAPSVPEPVPVEAPPVEAPPVDSEPVEPEPAEPEPAEPEPVAPRAVVRPRRTTGPDKSAPAKKGKDAKVTPKRVAGR